MAALTNLPNLMEFDLAVHSVRGKAMMEFAKKLREARGEPSTKCEDK